MLRWFLEHGASPNTRSIRTRGSCARPILTLSAAAKLYDAAPVKLLLAHGAEIDPMAIYYALGHRTRGAHTSCATLAALVEHGVDVNSEHEVWGTPLTYAAVEANNEAKVTYLLAHGADPTMRSKVGNETPGEAARKSGRTRMAEILERAQQNQMP